MRPDLDTKVILFLAACIIGVLVIFAFMRRKPRGGATLHADAARQIAEAAHDEVYEHQVVQFLNRVGSEIKKASEQGKFGVSFVDDVQLNPGSAKEVVRRLELLGYQTHSAIGITGGCVWDIYWSTPSNTKVP